MNSNGQPVVALAVVVVRSRRWGYRRRVPTITPANDVVLGSGE
jgi:hypothetical protein